MVAAEPPREFETKLGGWLDSDLLRGGLLADSPAYPMLRVLLESVAAGTGSDRADKDAAPALLVAAGGFSETAAALSKFDRVPLALPESAAKFLLQLRTGADGGQWRVKQLVSRLNAAFKDTTVLQKSVVAPAELATCSVFAVMVWHSSLVAETMKAASESVQALSFDPVLLNWYLDSAGIEGSASTERGACSSVAQGQQDQAIRGVRTLVSVLIVNSCLFVCMQHRQGDGRRCGALLVGPAAAL
jgi:hypothetical protein